MQHVAIDLGGKASQICVRESDGRVRDERSVATVEIERYLAGEGTSRVKRGCRVIVETCAEGFAVAELAMGLGHEVRVVPGTLVRSLGVGARQIKTDRRDARVLSEVSTRIDLPSVHIPQKAHRQLKTVCGIREALVNSRTKLINTVRGYLRTQLVRVTQSTPATFNRRVNEAMMRRSLAIPTALHRQLAVIDTLNVQIALADDEIKSWSQDNDVAQRLMTVPGVGPVTAACFIAAIDSATRFPDASSLCSYLGLTPGEHSSSGKTRRTGITKAGPSRVRWTLMQAAWILRRWRPGDPIVRWNMEVERRRGKHIAVVALARKLAGVMYAMWRDGTAYNPLRAADRSAPL